MDYVSYFFLNQTKPNTKTELNRHQIFNQMVTPLYLLTKPHVLELINTFTYPTSL